MHSSGRGENTPDIKLSSFTYSPFLSTLKMYSNIYLLLFSWCTMGKCEVSWARCGRLYLAISFPSCPHLARNVLKASEVGPFPSCPHRTAHRAAGRGLDYTCIWFEVLHQSQEHGVRPQQSCHHHSNGASGTGVEASICWTEGCRTPVNSSLTLPYSSYCSISPLLTAPYWWRIKLPGCINPRSDRGSSHLNAVCL